jgi:hypothetical protein
VRTHGNRRYVKLAWIGLLAAFVPASPAQAELVTSGAGRGVLAVAADGTPYVAYTAGRVLYVTVRAKTGVWRPIRLGRLPGPNVVLAGIEISDRPQRYVSVLAQDLNGRWIALARGSRLQTIARADPGKSYGPAGLTLDARGRPALAYAVQRRSGGTFLRLVTFERGNRAHTRGITKKGFPNSEVAPGAAPVLVQGRLHVVETYTSAAIDWGPTTDGGWEGQFLFASRLGTPQGAVGAVYLSSTLWSAWTQVYSDEISVLLTSSAKTQETFALTRGIFVDLARGESEPEVAAYDWVTLADDWFVYAGLVVRGTGSAAWQLDGRIDGYVIGKAGTRQLLLSRENHLEWFRAPPPGLPAIAIRMGPVGAGGVASGTVVGATGGTVEIWHEIPHAPRELVATVGVAADGSFEASIANAGPDALYRAVYVDAATGIPFGFLPGVAVGVSD